MVLWCSEIEDGPLNTFWLTCFVGLAVFAVICAFARSDPQGNQGTTLPVGKLVFGQLVGVFVSTLVVVLACARSSLFVVLERSCTAATACALSLTPLLATLALFVLSWCRRVRPFGELLCQCCCVSVGTSFAAFFTGWLTISTYVLTFKGPFIATSNAFFASWIGVGCASLMLCASIDEAKATRLLRVVADTAADPLAAANGRPREFQREALVGVCVFSLALFGATVPLLSATAEATYLICGAVLSALTGILLLVRHASLPPMWRTVLTILLSLLWTTLVWFSTFSGPFVATGNGFFFAYGGFGCSVLVLLGESAGGSSARRGGLSVLGVGAASLVLVIISNGGRDGFELFALVISGVSLALVLLTLIHRALKAAEADELAQTVICTCQHACSAKMAIDWKVETLTAAFLASWWLVAVGVLTFIAPYNLTSNAWLACWAAFASSCSLLVDRVYPSASADAKSAFEGERGACSLLLGASFVLVMACVALRESSDAAVWVMVACALTTLLACLLLFATCAPPTRSGFVAALAVLWISVIWSATFDGPFAVTGNAYFAAWLGLGASMRLLLADEGLRAICLAHSPRSPDNRLRAASYGLWCRMCCASLVTRCRADSCMECFASDSTEVEDRLPDNWVAAHNEEGKAYYINELTGETSWDVPDGASSGRGKKTTGKKHKRGVLGSSSSEGAEAADGGGDGGGEGEDDDENASEVTSLTGGSDKTKKQEGAASFIQTLWKGNKSRKAEGDASQRGASVYEQHDHERGGGAFPLTLGTNGEKEEEETPGTAQFV